MTVCLIASAIVVIPIVYFFIIVKNFEKRILDIQLRAVFPEKDYKKCIEEHVQLMLFTIAASVLINFSWFLYLLFTEGWMVALIPTACWGANMTAFVLFVIWFFYKSESLNIRGIF